MLGLIKKIFIGLLTCIVKASNHAKCLSLNNQKCMTHPTLFNLHPNENSQEFHYYRFAVDILEVAILLMTYLVKYVFQIKKKINLSVFSMITGINESKTLSNHISCECKCKFDGRKCNSNQWRNNAKC